MESSIAMVYQSSKTVLTNKDLSLIWKETNPENLKAKIAYYVKRGVLLKLTRGVYAKDQNYEPKELAGSLYQPSYLSFETVLREAGIIFQHFESIFVAGPWTKKVEIDGRTYVFRKLKESVLYNPRGVENRGNYSIATVERAFLDTLYLFPKFYGDNLKPLNKKFCFELVKIYGNQQLEKRLRNYF